MKKISDIRLYRKSDEMRPTAFASKPLNLAVRRVVMKLREQNFSLGDFDHLYLVFTTCQPAGTVKLMNEIDPYHPWYRYCDIGISQSAYETLENADNSDFILDHLKAVLQSKFCSDAFTSEIVDKSIVEARKGAAMRMRFKEKRSAKLIAVIYLRLLDDGQYLPLLQVTDYNGNEILAADLPKTLDLNIIGEIQLNSKRVAIKPRKNGYSKGLQPISFDLQ